MTVPEEIEQLKNRLAKASDKKQQAEINKELLRAFASIYSTASMPYIDSLLQLAEELNCDDYRAWALCYSALHHYLKGNFDSSLKFTYRAYPLFLKLGDKNGLARTYQNAGMVSDGQGNYLEAIRNYKLALQYRQEIDDKRGIANIYNNIGNLERGQHNYTEALKNHYKALEIRKKIGDKNGTAISYNNIGNVQFEQSKYTEALGNYLRCLPVFEELGDKRGMAYAYSNIGGVYGYEGNFPEALKSHLKALHLKEEIGDKRGIAYSRMEVGVFHKHLGNYSAALNCYRSALLPMEEVGDKKGIALTNEHIGNIYFTEGNYPNALDSYLRALSISEEIGNKEGIANAFNHIGTIYETQNNFKEALKNHLQALQLSQQTGNKLATASFYNSIGAVYEKQGNQTQAIENKLQALRIAEEIGHKLTIKDSLLGLFNSYKALNDFETALLFHEKYHNINNELLGEQAQKQLTSLNFQHNMEQKEKEAEIERLKNVELKEALENLKLEKSRSEQLFQNQLQDIRSNALQAQMNPHFVFNSLNSIQQYIWEKDPEEATAYLTRFSKLIRLVLDNSRRQYVSLEQDLTALEYYIELESLRFENKFEHEIICDSSIDRSNLQLPPMLIQPFVENAITHGLQPLKTAGKLTISLQRRDKNLLHITIEDNGIGRYKAGRLKAGKEGNHQSVAIQLTKERLQKMNDAILAEHAVVITDLFDKNKNPTGTKVEMCVPVEPD